MKILLTFLLFFSLSAGAEELKVLTWNVFMIPKPINFTYQKERTDHIVKILASSSYDVIFLQEAFTGSFRRKLKNRTEKVFPHQHYLKRKFFSPTILGSGVYILSRHPLKSIKKIYYRSCAGADCFASKGASLVSLKLPEGKEIQLAATHLQAGDDKRRSKIRLKQLKQLQKLISKNAKAGVPQVLLGDLNIEARHEDFSISLDLLQMDSLPLEGDIDYTSGFPTECYNKPGDDTHQWLDHIWVGRNSNLSVSDKRVRIFRGLIDGRECPLSDHYAVEANLFF